MFTVNVTEPEKKSVVATNCPREAPGSGKAAMGETSVADSASNAKETNLDGMAGVTVNRKLLVALVMPSETVSVIIALPTSLMAGTTVIVLLESKPPNKIFSSGTRVGFEDVPWTYRLAAGKKASPT